MTISPITKGERDEIVRQLKRGAAPFNLRSAFLSYEAALAAAEGEIERLREALLKIGECTAWIGVPIDSEAASYLGQTLQELVFIARAALEGEKK